MPSDQATEKSELLLKLGAVVERVPPAPIIDPMHFVNRARTLAAEHTADPHRPGRGYFVDQFENQTNWQAHYHGTGPEIFRQCGGNVDAFVAGAGTGGTITGVARYLKPKMSNIKIVLSDPQGSGLYNRIKYGVMFDVKEREGTRRRSQVDTIVEGIGINRVTANFEAGRQLIDDAIKVEDDQALAMARWLVEKDGVFVGSSSAVNCQSDASEKNAGKLTSFRCRCSEIRKGAWTRSPDSDRSLRFRNKASFQVLGQSRKCWKQDKYHVERNHRPLALNS